MPAGSAEKSPWFLVDKLDLSQRHIAVEIKDNYVPGCISKITASRSRKVIISPSLVLPRVHLKQSTALGAPVQERDPDKLKQAQKRDSQTVRGLEH